MFLFWFVTILSLEICCPLLLRIKRVFVCLFFHERNFRFNYFVSQSAFGSVFVSVKMEVNLFSFYGRKYLRSEI